MYSIKKQSLIALFSFAAGLLFTISSCKKTDNETATENITRVTLHFTGDGVDTSFVWSDIDGPGGNNPIVPVIALPAGKTLTCSIGFWDDSVSPVNELTPEIAAENKVHLVVYSTVLQTLQIQYADTDDNGAPLGLATQWITHGISEGTVTVTLHHEPSDKSNLASPGGEVDYEATFSVVQF